ncbi:MAG: T9SS type A sorting domain-containing protein [Ignavibacteriales bacterium]|nr:T9SS type A sorting domain-containing protein [Ignavibacteriales bacterium]
MRIVLFGMLLLASITYAHNSYTGGYSGAPGMRTCASSCHGSGSGTLVVNGFPASYVAGQTYRLTVAHVGGSPIVNFNLTTRIGSTSVVGGTFAPVSNSTLYSGADGGVYASPHTIDSAVINWTAPAKGSGIVTLYAAAFQGTTSSGSGQSRALSITSAEIVTSVDQERSMPLAFSLHQNYPNPFNPSTALSFRLSAISLVTLKVSNALGEEVATLVNEVRPAGLNSVRWDASSLPSGVYYYRLQSNGYLATKKMLLLR